jgi:ribosomal-protein-alanine N-acetyltransferase
MLTFQSYTSNMRQRCIEIFRSNVPKFFLEHEVADYARFLDNIAPNNYWCAFDGEIIVGAGGIWVRSDGIGRLVFGIVRRDLHLKGYGRQLVNFRLKKLAEQPNLEIVQLDTSQHNPGFFKRFGFRELSAVENKYGPGLHSHAMELRLDSESRRKIQAL